MKKTLLAILRNIVKAIYPLVKAKRNVLRRIKTKFAGPQKRSQNAAARAKSDESAQVRRYNPRKRVRPRTPAAGVSYRSADTNRRYRNKNTPLWKDKRIIIASCAVIVIVSVVLSLALSGSGKDVYALSNAPKGSNTASPATAPATDSAHEELAYAFGNELQGNISGVLENGIENTSLPEVTSLPTATPVPTTKPDETLLIPRTHDSRVINIQIRLMELGYMEPDEPTDFYGPVTEYSLKLFQRKHDLKIDGHAGQETLAVLFSNDVKYYSVKLGDNGTDVELLQDRLKDLGYFKSKANGNFGPATEKAVKSFQKINKLEVDGSVGEQTREALFSEEAKEAPKPAPKPTAKPKPTSSKPKSTKKPSGGTEKPKETDPPVEVGDPDKASADALIALAESLKGSKYSRGGKGPKKFDCSGFVYYCLNKVGRKTKYMTSTAWKNCSLPKITKMEDMQPGDIIVFKTHHVGIYIGNGQMIDASSTNGKVVKRSCMTAHWKKEFANARRVF